MGFLFMRILVFISIVIASVGLQSCNSTVKSVYRDDFRSASEAEIKKAYRKMAISFHPDKVAQMGEEYQKGAKEKFQRIQEAYDNIKKARGL